jgi:hypothetical protein
VFVGVLVRVWLALISDNADSKTLTWGASYAAVSPSHDPWLATASHSLGDPIPLNNTRALSLATGPIPVVAGALALKAADLAGVIDLPRFEDLSGRQLPHGASIVHRLSYLFPEMLVVLLIVALARRRGRARRDAMLFCWATTPLVAFTFGQGMPDTWTIAVVLGGWLALERAAAAPAGRRKTLLYGAALAAGTLGAFWTKLFPAVLLFPALLVLWKDVQARSSRRPAVAIGLMSLAVGLLPYVLSRPMYVSMFVRFEFDMLEDATSVKLLSALPTAGLALIVMVAALTWAISTTRLTPLERAEGLLVALTLSATLLSGIISHLIVWALPAVLLVVRRAQRNGLILHTAVSLVVLLHLVWYDWLDGLVLDAVAPRIGRGAPWDTLQRVVPMANLLASGIAAFALVAVAVALGSYIRDIDNVASRDLSSRFRRLVVVPPLVLIGTLIVAATAAAQTGTPSANTKYEFWDSNQPSKAGETAPVLGSLLLRRGDVWTSKPMNAVGPADRALVQLEKATQFSTDLMQIEILDASARVVATAALPVWDAEPNSERWPAEFRFDRHVTDIHGMAVRVRRVASGAGPADAQLLLPALTVQRRNVTGELLAPIWGVDVELRESNGRHAFGVVAREVFALWRLGLAIGIGALGAALVLIVRRRFNLGVPDATVPGPEATAGPIKSRRPDTDKEGGRPSTVDSQEVSR